MRLARSAGVRERPWRVLLGSVVASGLGVTALVTGLLVADARDDAQVRTFSELRTVGDAVERQVSSYAETLFALRADLAQRPGMSRQEFTALVDVEALTLPRVPDSP